MHGNDRKQNSGGPGSTRSKRPKFILHRYGILQDRIIQRRGRYLFVTPYMWYLFGRSCLTGAKKRTDSAEQGLRRLNQRFGDPQRRSPYLQQSKGTVRYLPASSYLYLGVLRPSERTKGLNNGFKLWVQSHNAGRTRRTRLC